MSNTSSMPRNFSLHGGHNCAGCGEAISVRSALRAMFEVSKDIILQGESCGGGGADTGFLIGIGRSGAAASGLEAALRLRGIEGKHLVVFSGEGQVFEFALDSLAAVFRRRQQIAYIVLDNQAYASSGRHMTSSTLRGAQVSMYPAGVRSHPQETSLMMIFSGAAYVATAAVCYLSDFERKIKGALQNKPSLVHVFCPCVISWGSKPDETVSLMRLGVETGLFPLWEYKRGSFERTVTIKERRPVNDFVRSQRRFAGISGEDLEALEAYAERLNQTVDALETGFGSMSKS